MVLTWTIGEKPSPQYKVLGKLDLDSEKDLGKHMIAKFKIEETSYSKYAQDRIEGDFLFIKPFSNVYKMINKKKEELANYFPIWLEGISTRMDNNLFNGIILQAKEATVKYSVLHLGSVENSEIVFYSTSFLELFNDSIEQTGKYRREFQQELTEKVISAFISGLDGENGFEKITKIDKECNECNIETLFTEAYMSMLKIFTHPMYGKDEFKYYEIALRNFFNSYFIARDLYFKEEGDFHFFRWLDLGADPLFEIILVAANLTIPDYVRENKFYREDYYRHVIQYVMLCNDIASIPKGIRMEKCINHILFFSKEYPPSYSMKKLNNEFNEVSLKMMGKYKEQFVSLFKAEDLELQKKLSEVIDGFLDITLYTHLYSGAARFYRVATIEFHTISLG